MIAEDIKQSKIVEYNNLLGQRDFTARKVVFELAETLQKLYRDLELPFYEKYKAGEAEAKKWRKVISIIQDGAEIADDIWEDFLETPDKYMIDEDGFLVENPNYEYEQIVAEEKRVNNLNLSGADVERGLYEAKNIDFDDIIALVEEKLPHVDIKRLKHEFKANNFYRGNSFVNNIGGLLGLSKEQLDAFFEDNDYHHLK